MKKNNFDQNEISKMISKEVPSKEEIVEVALSKVQKKYYRAIFDQNQEILKGRISISDPNSRLKLLNVLMQIRKCCNHPFLIRGAESKETKGLKNWNDINELMISASSKLQVLDQLLKKLHVEGHKVLIFSQMVTMLDILEDYCTHRKFNYCRLDGRTVRLKRQQQIDQFCDKKQNKFVFLLSTRVSVGLNLMEADTIIFYDSDWNPQNDTKVHGIVQKWDVKIYRFLTKETFETRIFEAVNVRQLEKGKKSNEGDYSNKLNQKEIEEILLNFETSNALKGKEDD